MKAQELYDLREKFEFCSGNDLSTFFAKAIGEPSPNGNAEISDVLAQGFVANSLEQMHENNKGLDSLYTTCEQAILFSFCKEYVDPIAISTPWQEMKTESQTTATHQVVADSHGAIAISYAWSKQEAQAQATEMRLRYGNADIRVRGEFVPDLDEG